MRYFIALEIPENSKAELSELQDNLKSIIPDLKLSNSEKLHLTIAFIGEESDTYKEALIEMMTKSTEGITPFLITPGYIDGFPNLHTAKTLWIGVKGDIDKLLLIRHRIKDGLTHLKLNTDERRFIPHIALGKLNNFSITPSQEMDLQKLESKSFQTIRVDSIKLFESVPDHTLHKHNTLAEVKLG